MREIAVVSADGGAGKTSLVASFAALSGNVVLAECDVHGADLHTVLKPPIRSWENFLYCRGVVVREKDCAR